MLQQMPSPSALSSTVIEMSEEGSVLSILLIEQQFQLIIYPRILCPEDVEVTKLVMPKPHSHCLTYHQC